MTWNISTGICGTGHTELQLARGLGVCSFELVDPPYLGVFGAAFLAATGDFAFILAPLLRRLVGDEVSWTILLEAPADLFDGDLPFIDCCCQTVDSSAES